MALAWRYRLGGTGLVVPSWWYWIGGIVLASRARQCAGSGVGGDLSGSAGADRRGRFLGGTFQLRNSATPGGGVAELRSWKRAPVFPGGSRGRMNHEAHGLDPARRPPWVPPSGWKREGVYSTQNGLNSRRKTKTSGRDFGYRLIPTISSTPEGVCFFLDEFPVG